MKLTKIQEENLKEEIKNLSKEHELSWCVSKEKDGLWICASVDKIVAPKKSVQVGVVKIKKIIKIKDKL